MLPEFTLSHLLLNSVERDPGHAAVVDGARICSYEDLWRQASRLAGALLEYGVRRGDRVGIYLDKSLEAVVSMFAVSQIGAAFVNINSQLKEAQARHIISNCRTRALIADANKVPALASLPVESVFYHGEGMPPITCAVASLSEILVAGREAPAVFPVTETDLSTIIYTSGSTGLPKGIMLSHRNLVAGAQIVSTYVRNTSSDRILSILPLNFDAGLNQLTTMVRVGGTLVLQRSLLPGEILRNLRTHSITGLAGVPSVWPLLLQNRRSLEREPLAHLRYITNTGGMIPQPNLDSLRRLLPGTDIYLMYGLTEAFRSTYLPPDEVHRGSSCIGRAIPNTDIWVVDEKNEECAVDEVGELIHRGPTVALGYWGDEERTRAVYRPNPFAPPELQATDNVVYSGDLVKRDKDGYLYFLGRRDELIKTQGFRVSPHEIESIFYGIPEVREAAVFGKGSIGLGHAIVAVISLKDGAAMTPEEVRAIFSRSAPPYMLPREIHILPELPKTVTGKIDRSGLRHEFADV